jgi:predicted molibdopterin-dependent oxidoreductase YjgC
MDQFTCGLGVFHPIAYAPPDENPDEKFPIYLTTGRVLSQYHTGTMTMKTRDLNELDPECFVELSGKDADDYQIQDGDMIRVASRRGEIRAKARVSEKAVKGTIFIPFHYSDAAANVLTNPARDPIAKIPEYKVCAVRIEKA